MAGRSLGFGCLGFGGLKRFYFCSCFFQVLCCCFFLYVYENVLRWLSKDVQSHCWLVACFSDKLCQGQHLMRIYLPWAFGLCLC